MLWKHEHLIVENCFSTTMPHDWLEKLAPIFQSIRSKTAISRDPLALVFPRFASATCNASSSDWFTGLSVFFVIGYTDYFGFGFTALNENRTKNMVLNQSARVFSLRYFLCPAKLTQIVIFAKFFCDIWSKLHTYSTLTCRTTRL